MLPDLRFDIVALDKSLAAFRSVQTNLARMNAETKALNVGAASLGMQFSAIGKGLVIGGAITGLVAAGRAVQSLVGETADLVDTADKIGVGVEFLQEMQFAAKRSGADIATLDAGLATFSRNLGLAASGAGGDFAKVLEQNGVALRDVDGRMRPVNDLVREYADLVKNAGSESERLLLTQLAFGKGAGDLVGMLRGGADAIDDLAEARRALGPLTTDEDARRLKEIDDQWKNIADTITFGVKGAIVGLISAVSEFGEKLRSISEDGRYFADASGRVLANQSERFKNAFPNFDQSFGFRMPKTVGALGEALGLNDFAGGTKLNLSKDDGAKREQERIDRVIEGLKLQTENLTRTNREQAIYNDLHRAGVDIDSKWGQVVAELSGEFYDQSEAIRVLNEAAEFFGDTISDALSDLIFKGESFEDVMRGVAIQIGEAALQAALLGQGPLASLFGLAPTGGLSVGGILGAIFGGFRAEGGPVRAGRAYMVGERGREIFVPSANGEIIPSRSADGGITVVPHVAIDMRGADAQTIARIQAEQVPAIVQAAVAASVQAIRNGRANDRNFIG